MRTRKLISGPVLLGFATEFDAAYGKPCASMPRVTPSRIGKILLPFACPHCGAVRSETIDPKTRTGYRDAERGFSWCPACMGRYVINIEGMPLAESLPKGATAGPARIERNAKTKMSLAPREGGLDMLGAA